MTLELLPLIYFLEELDGFYRDKTNIKTPLYEQESLSYKSESVISVTIDGVVVDDVVQFCIVNHDGVFYLYVGVKIDTFRNKYVKYLISGIVNIGL